MAPIKFEENIKSTIEKRTIQPSENAWNKLANTLDTQEKKKNRKLFLSLGIAASIIGVLLMATLVFNNDSQENTLPLIVDTPNIVEDEPAQVIVQEVKVDIEESQEKKEIKQPSKRTVKPQKIEKSAPIIEPVVEQEIVAQIEEVEQPVLTPEEEQIQEVVAQIVELKEKNGSVTDAEIDALLNQAQEKIAQNNSYNVNTNTVNANALLRDVEVELDPSFRNKVFETLKSNYNSIKTAVAQRND